ncbi:flagellar protein FlgN [Bremerella sp. T1]|uniref:flagellar protein FlgN n=1 Tax=Bremerella sp. TYQ1 TaxID=3119568 RepID=UPI001CCB5F7A|nr:flagellar protein FlgN [Bremerella volcania]UBM38205.1 flagellar protein FlgN [Bremerella volcania]
MPCLEETDQLVQLIDQKHEVLTQLLTLSQYQLRLAGHDSHIDDLMRVLAAKQTLIERLTRIDRTMDPFRQQNPESRVWRSASERTQCSQKAKQCEVLLTELKQLEHKSTEVVASHRDEISKLLRETHTSVDSASAYSEMNAPTSGGFDFTAE